MNVTGQALTSTSLFVSWSPVPLEHRSGIILGYNLSYWKANDSSNTNVTLTTDKEEIEIDGLEKFTPYMVAVSAFNQIGVGVFSDPIQIWTSEDGKHRKIYRSFNGSRILITENVTTTAL